MFFSSCDKIKCGLYTHKKYIYIYVYRYIKYIKQKNIIYMHIYIYMHLYICCSLSKLLTVNTYYIIGRLPLV